ncbi:MAG: radical SAM protein [Desulfobacterota bacterium]|nr:radical SAM protein [Thermodesulfobacteriota bacterium]MDW8001050.1 radical SAM protein [Deltaproteobacteria bacterium]
MVSITKLYCGAKESFDEVRYGTPPDKRKPVVVWNITKSCNLFCKHCYANAEPGQNEESIIDTKEAKEIIEDFASFGVPVILFSGGEPLLRHDIFELLKHAKMLGLRTVLSTNGTLITKKVAEQLAESGISYVGVSLDGVGDVNDLFRGRLGAFDEAKEGIRNCKEAKIKIGIRFTITKENYHHIPEIFDFFEDEDIDRLCFYHLVYSGRAKSLMDLDLDHETRRRVLDYIIERTKAIYAKNRRVEVLTVDNHADGPYVYLKLLREDPKRAKEVYQFLLKNGGNLSGIGIVSIDERGDVHPDQFWKDYTLGNLKERSLGSILSNDGLIKALRNKKSFLTGRCARCRFIDICGGNFRVRAYAKTSDLWAPDPQCYLTDEEIS